MTGNKVMKLWTTIVTAFFALLSALGLASPAAATSVQQAAETSNAAVAAPSRTEPVHTAPAHDGSLPPTMKQRIRAEAHGSTPRCRRLPRQSTTGSVPAGAPAADSDGPQRHMPGRTAASGTTGQAGTAPDVAATASTAPRVSAATPSAAQADPLAVGTAADGSAPAAAPRLTPMRGATGAHASTPGAFGQAA